MSQNGFVGSPSSVTSSPSSSSSFSPSSPMTHHMMENSHQQHLSHQLHPHHLSQTQNHHTNSQMFNSMNPSIHLQSLSKGNSAMNPNVITLFNSTNGSLPSLPEHTCGKFLWFEY